MYNTPFKRFQLPPEKKTATVPVTGNSGSGMTQLEYDHFKKVEESFFGVQPQQSPGIFITLSEIEYQHYKAIETSYFTA
jgi:hypothetical protein